MPTKDSDSEMGMRRNLTAVSGNIVDKSTVKLGFIGLGLMGSRLVRRLHSSGWNIQAWNRSPEPISALRQEGITTAESIASLVAESDVVLSCLANDAAVESVYLDSGGVLSVAAPGTIILEMSTISPFLSRSLHLQAANKGVRVLDLAISGSTPAVDAGAVTLLVGGDQSTFGECTPIYESIARQWFLVGPGSSGVRMKLVVNLLLGVEMQALAEAVSLGEHLLLDRDVLLDVLSKTTVIPPALTGKIQKIRSRDYSAQFPLRLMSKDMDLVMEAAETSDAVLPAAAVVRSVIASSLSENGDLDLAALARTLSRHTSRI